MNKMTLRMKSGKEFNFQCEEFEIVRSNVMGRELTGAKIDGAIYFITGDVESITWHKPTKEEQD